MGSCMVVQFRARVQRNYDFIQVSFWPVSKPAHKPTQPDAVLIVSKKLASQSESLTPAGFHYAFQKCWEKNVRYSAKFIPLLI